MLSAKVNTTDMVDDMRVAAIRNNVSAARNYLLQGWSLLSCDVMLLTFFQNQIYYDHNTE